MLKEWFVLQYKAKSHHKAVRNLKQQGFETFLPLTNLTLRQNSRFINATQPLFPGYMFITFDSTKSEWYKINNTYGVSRLVTFNNILKSIPNEVIEYLLERCNLSGELLPVKKYERDDKVKILKGPFANFIANVEKYETDQRIWVLMDLMSRRAKLQISLEDVQLSN